ncbi:MAG: hypothetical protein JRD89_01990 [Deltaproteobacteria bacterium]|nr:hypothetical protein [Deltaproteobacteria bacterium]
MPDRAIIEELVEWMNIFTRDEGIAFETYEVCEDDYLKVRAFRPTPGPEPDESIAEVRMMLAGSTPNENSLVHIVLNEDGEAVYMSLNAPAIAAVVLHYRET